MSEEITNERRESERLIQRCINLLENIRTANAGYCFTFLQPTHTEKIKTGIYRYFFNKNTRDNPISIKFIEAKTNDPHQKYYYIEITSTLQDNLRKKMSSEKAEACKKIIDELLILNGRADLPLKPTDSKDVQLSLQAYYERRGYLVTFKKNHRNGFPGIKVEKPDKTLAAELPKSKSAV